MFEDPDKALQAALKVEDHVQIRNQRASNEPIHYRIALHHGEVWAISSGGGDVHGNDINTTFRIEGDQSNAFSDAKALFPKYHRILCSERFWTALQNLDGVTLPGNFHCGAAKLKGIVDVVDIRWLKTQYSSEDIDSTLGTRID